MTQRNDARLFESGLASFPAPPFSRHFRQPYVENFNETR